MAFENITGQKFGRLTVLRKTDKNRHRQQIWECICECGKKVFASTSSLKSKNTQSCGCYKKHKLTTKMTKHGMHNSTEYRTWWHIIGRCHTETNRSYSEYGGRGITVCQRWRDSFEAFYADMGPKPHPDYSIDRIDNDGNYEPSNCRWADRTVQSTNQRLYKTNTYGCKGIYYDKKRKKWCAHIGSLRRHIHLGRFETLKEAIVARKAAELKYHDPILKAD